MGLVTSHAERVCAAVNLCRNGSVESQRAAAREFLKLSEIDKSYFENEAVQAALFTLISSLDELVLLDTIEVMSKCRIQLMKGKQFFDNLKSCIVLLDHTNKSIAKKSLYFTIDCYIKGEEGKSVWDMSMTYGFQPILMLIEEANPSSKAIVLYIIEFLSTVDSVSRNSLDDLIGIDSLLKVCKSCEIEVVRFALISLANVLTKVTMKHTFFERNGSAILLSVIKKVDLVTRHMAFNVIRSILDEYEQVWDEYPEELLFLCLNTLQYADSETKIIIIKIIKLRSKIEDHKCDNCTALLGGEFRWMCTICPNFTLCENCYLYVTQYTHTDHRRSHQIKKSEINVANRMSLEFLPTFMNISNESEMDVRILCYEIIRDLCSNPHIHIHLMRESLLAFLDGMARSEYQVIQELAACSFHELLANENTRDLIARNYFQTIMDLTRSSSERNQFYSVGCIAYLCLMSLDTKITLIEQGLLQSFLCLAYSPKANILENFSRAFKNLTSRANNFVIARLVKGGCFGAINHLCRSDLEVIQCNTLDSLANILAATTEDSESLINFALHDPETINCVTALTHSQSDRVKDIAEIVLSSIMERPNPRLPIELAKPKISEPSPDFPRPDRDDSKTIRFKFVMRGEVRIALARRSISYSEFLQMINHEYGSSMLIYYDDGRGDKVLINDDSDLDTGLQVLDKSKLKSLKIYLHPIERPKTLSPLSEWNKIPYSELKSEEIVGSGSFSVVKRGFWRNMEVAIKEFHASASDIDFSEIFRSELTLISKLRHPNVIAFIGASVENSHLCIVTEYAANGTLYKVLHSPISIPWKRCLQMAIDAANGIDYLHTCDPMIVHKDLKSANLLVLSDWTVKVCDFGLSRMKLQSYCSAGNGSGTFGYASPECIRNEKFNEKVDIYSFGVVLWELLTRRTPYENMNPYQIIASVELKKETLEIPEMCPADYAELIRSCLQHDPTERPTMKQVIETLQRFHFAIL